ncbi:hypothetical protein BGZ95_005964, partial [Linnemannia exigua]
NIMFAPGMRLRIGDLGLAARYDKKDLKKGACGTIGFMAPEVVQGKPHTFSMDIYSLGCIAYIMLQGKNPWLTKGRQIFPNRLKDLLTMDECKLTPDSKRLVRKLLDFTPKTRLCLKDLPDQRFMVYGYSPENLGEEVFDHEPEFITEGKRKAEKSEADEKAKAKIKLDLDEKANQA